MIKTESRLNTQTGVQSKSKSAAAKSSGTGWKVFIMVASLAGMIGGWGVLAVDQGQNVAAAQTQVVQSSTTTSTSQTKNSQSTGLRQVTGQQSFPQVITRSRSSR